MTTELAVIDAETGELLPAVNLFGTSEPKEVVLRAKQYADELANVIKERQLFRVIGGKAHVYVEAWTLLGSMLGVFPVVDEVEPVEIDGVAGFRASVRAVTRTGEVVGRSVSYCMRDEPMWSLNPVNKYGKPLEVRNLHALAAMAETRATSRALRKPLGFIVQLAGYSPTAAEEMPTGGAAPAKIPDVPEALQPTEPDATEKQKNALNALVGQLRTAGVVTTEQVWLEAGYPEPIPRDDGTVHWSDLRDRLSKRTAHRLMDWLVDLQKQMEEPGQKTLATLTPAEVRKRMETGE